MIDPILDNLNEQQYRAVTAPEGPLLIVAGAGTGKTRVITRRMAYLVRERGIRPWEMYAATFTNKAAEEMRHRVAALATGCNPSDFHIGTFHSMCSKILRRDGGAVNLPSNFTICDDKDQQAAIKQVIARLGMTDKILRPSDAQYVVNQCKMRMLGPEGVPEIAADNHELFQEIFVEYEKYLQSSGAVDFEDLILKTVQLFQNNTPILEDYQRRYRYVMVDEYQDTNKVQVELVSLLAKKHRNLTVVGDEDQSIYSWRGADITNLLDFQKHFPDAQVLRLEQNYRSVGNILKAADAVISLNNERLGKTLFTEDEDGGPIYVMVGRNDYEEAEGVVAGIERLHQNGLPYSDMAIFYRVSSLSRNLEDALRKSNVPYRVLGGTKFYERAEIKDLISYLQVACNPNNTIALQRIINTPRRGLGNKSIDTLMEYASRNDTSLHGTIKQALSGANIDLPRGSIPKLSKFVELVTRWQKFADHHSPSETLQRILDDTDYITHLGDSNLPEVIARKENISELQTSIIEMERNQQDLSLNAYLENVTLVSVTDDLDPDDDAVSLMTLHAAKGLEYKAVFMTGVEETIFPNTRAAMDRGNFEEERRLFYVGITRAREVLILSRAAERNYFGDKRYNGESSFFHELPPELLRPMNPYNPEFHATLDEAPTDVDISPPPVDAAMGPLGYAHFNQGSYNRGSSRNYPRSRQTRVPFGAGPPPPRQAPRQPAGPKTFPLGSRVRHGALGEGVISGFTNSGPDICYVIHMDDGTEFLVQARYAKLELLSDD